jgi:competence protein ComEA
MVEQSPQPSREEREFWDPQFHDPPRPRRGGRALPVRDRRPPAFSRVTERFRDRVSDWRHDARFGIVLLIGVALVAGVIWYRVGIDGASAGESGESGGAPAAVSTTAPSTTLADAGSEASATKGEPSSIAVHVAGAVQHPGVVELRAGARVIDAVEAVGGALAGGDLDRLNLAAKVTDGQRVYVAKMGQSDPGVVGDAAGGTATADPSAGAPTGGKVNLNTATQAQLEELPGIGPTYAQAIIAERQRKGGFTSVNDLRSVRGIGDKRFAELAPLVTV